MNWDKYYLDTCKTIATNSKCLSRHIGAIIVRDKSIISTGYNGPPRGVPECDQRYTLDKPLIKALAECDNINSVALCPRKVLGYKSGQGLEWCIAGHAERNAIINAARNGICVKDTTIYMDCPIPCKDCLIEIINAGIKEIVCTELTTYDETSNYIIDNKDDLIIRTYNLREE